MGVTCRWTTSLTLPPSLRRRRQPPTSSHSSQPVRLSQLARSLSGPPCLPRTGLRLCKSIHAVSGDPKAQPVELTLPFLPSFHRSRPQLRSFTPNYACLVRPRSTVQGPTIVSSNLEEDSQPHANLLSVLGLAHKSMTLASTFADLPSLSQSSSFSFSTPTSPSFTSSATTLLTLSAADLSTPSTSSSPTTSSSPSPSGPTSPPG